MRTTVSALTLSLLLAGTAHAQMDMASMPGMSMKDGDHSQHHHDDEQLGAVSFPTSCAPAVQPGIERGVALLHSFGYVKAQQQFQQVADADPNCAMARWGLAMTQYQELWGTPDAAIKAGAADMQKARDLAAASTTVTPREKAYIDALSAFFAPGDMGYFDRAEAYAAKMDALRAAYPDDVEAGAFDALAILAAAPPSDTDLSHAHRALAILQPLFEAHPDHPGLAHYIIHTCDTPRLAKDGLKAAQMYAEIAPSSPHALHMPAHIFSRLGMWEDSIRSNTASVEASAQAEAEGEPGVSHQMHADEFLIYAWLQTGEDQKAKDLTAQMAGIGHHMMMMPGMDDMKDAGPWFDNELRAIYAMETHDWQGLATMPANPKTEPYESFFVWWGRGVAAGHLKDAKLAGEALDGYNAAIEAMKASSMAPFVEGTYAGRDEVAAWKAWAEGDTDGALSLMRQAADRQDKLGQAEVDIPAREMLGDLLVMAGKPVEALVEYRISLVLSPNRLNTFLSAGAAAEAAGQTDVARGYYQQALTQTGNGAHTKRLDHARAYLKAG